MRFLGVLVVTVALSSLSAPLLAQGDPPAPIPALIARFVDNPDSQRALYEAVLACPMLEGTWQHDYVTALMALDHTPRSLWELTTTFSVAISICDDELMSAWLRTILEQHRADRYMALTAGTALGRSGSSANHLAALRTIYDPYYDDEVRSSLLSDWVRDHETPHHDAIRLAAEAYRRVPGIPPRYVTMSALIRVRPQEGEALGLSALRDLLAAVTERPDLPAAAPVMRGLMNSATNLDGSDPWLQELAARVTEFVSGERAVPRELRDQLVDGLSYVCLGPRAQSQARCQR
jgi:hypothetical protein